MINSKVCIDKVFSWICSKIVKELQTAQIAILYLFSRPSVCRSLSEYLSSID